MARSKAPSLITEEIVPGLGPIVNAILTCGQHESTPQEPTLGKLVRAGRLAGVLPPYLAA